MSDTKKWIDSETVEVTKTAVTSERVNLAGLKSALVSWQGELDNATTKVAEIKSQITEIEALPNRPEAPKVEVKPEDIIDPLFVKEEV